MVSIYKYCFILMEKRLDLPNLFTSQSLFLQFLYFKAFFLQQLFSLV